MSSQEYNGGEFAAEVLKKKDQVIFWLARGHIYPLIEGCEDRALIYRSSGTK